MASYSITPIDQMSAADVGVPPVQISGAMYDSVPSRRSSTVASGPDEHRDPEIGELHGAVAAEQDVRRLDVAMDDAGGMRMGEPGARGRDGTQQRRVAEHPAAHRGAEVAAVDELGDDVDVVVVPGAVEQPDDVRVVEASRDLDLACRAAAEGRVVRNRLDRDVAARLAVETPEDRAGPTEPDHGLDLVPTDDLTGREEGRSRIGGRGSSGGAW